VDSLNHPSTTQLPAPRSANKPQIPLAIFTSRLDTTRSTCRARRYERVELVRAVLFDNKLDTSKCVGSTRRTCRVSKRDVTSQMEFGLESVTVCKA